MRRIIAILVLMVYGTAVSAVSLNLHFCGDYLNHVSLGADKHGGCCCDKKQERSNCCEDRKIEFSTKQEHSYCSSIQTPEPLDFENIVLNSTLTDIKLLIASNQVLQSNESDPPPDIYSKDLFLRLNNLRI